MNKLAIGLVGLVLATAQMACAELIVNGDFEQPDLPGEWAYYFSIPGWTAAFGEIEIQRGSGVYTGQALPPGDQFVELDSRSNSGMFQNIPTYLGQRYTLSFYYSPRNGLGGQAFPADTNVIDVLWENRFVASITATGDWQQVNIWMPQTFDLVANSTTGFSRLQFNAAGTSDSYGGLLDKVSLTVIPEPSALVALLSLGAVGLWGFVRRKRRRC